MALAACGLFAVACGPATLPKMPDHLLGIWKTSAPRHAQNFIEIRRDSLVLGVVGLELEVIRIETIEVARQGAGEEVYRVHFTAAEGYPDVLALTWLENERAVRVGAAAGTWTRSAER
jgi:hypothetical protein